MKLYVVVLALWLGGGLLAGVDGVLGQATPPPLVELKQNYPNPFNPATTIPFTLNGALFADGHRPKVSLRIYNVLAQLVAIPLLQGTGEAMTEVELACSNPAAPCEFWAYWDGKVLSSDREAASGVYIYQLIVDGKRFTKKMIIMK
jgi:hypothetical protein